MSATALATEQQVALGEDDPGLTEVLDVVREFGLASLGLVAWEFCVAESAVAGAWSTAISQGLISAVGTCPESGETLFTLTD
jgi:hypothetical protein